MIWEIISMKDETGKYIFGLLVDNDVMDGAKTFIPCNNLLTEMKDQENVSGALLKRKVKIEFVEE